MADRDEATTDPTEATKREGAGPKRVAPPASYLTRGTLVGRYVVLDVLGEGGMGVVYSAFDPELDRKVAIKLLQARSGGSSGGDQAWLLREAQALARLSHPNVVAVHDVGVLPGDRVFVAMELVDGLTLRAWLKQARAWREVLPVLRAAGAGLAAAHAAGLVHRDFKPENVIVGADGRVRVMDFGLARLGAADEVGSPGAHLEAKSPLSERLTIAGTVVGTPAYMAPEIYQGDPADARSDQFAFGVALYEALYRARPYDKKDLQPPLSAVRPKTPPAMGSGGVPARIQRVVMRAIATSPSERYHSMDALLAELAIDPTRTRRRIVVGAGALIAVAALVGATFAMSRRRSELCTGTAQRLVGVWDGKVKDAVKAAFLATGKSFAPQSYAGLERALDAYTAKWTATAVESCEATRVHGEQTEEVLALRQACLDQRLEEVGALAGLLASADGGLVEKGDKAVFELTPLSGCSNVTALRQPGMPPVEVRPRLAALDKQIAEARAQVIAGKYLPALVAAQKAVDGAKQLGWEPAMSEALLGQAAALVATGNLKEATASYAASTWAALCGKRDDFLANAALSTAMVTADIGSAEAARVWLELGNAAAQRAGFDRTLELKRDEIDGVVYAQAGDLTAAVAAHEKALAAAELAYGKDNPAMWADEVMLATTYTKVGAFGRAAPHLERALALREGSVGRDHADVALILSNLGVSYRHLRDPRARKTFERALAIREKTYGVASPMLEATLDNFAEDLQQDGDPGGAIAMYDRALRIAKILPGTGHASYHTIATDRAEALVAAGKLAEAHAAYDDVLALEDKAHSSELPATLASRARLALAEHAWTDAAAFAERAIAGFEAAGGKDNPKLWRPLTALGQAKLGAGDPAAARPLVERAIAIAEKAYIPAEDLAEAREVLARLPAP